MERNYCGDFSETDSNDDSIFVVDPYRNRFTDCSRCPVFPVSQARIRTGQRADYLTASTEAVAGKVTLSGRHHTAWVAMFSGGKYHRTKAGTVFLDTGSPASFILRKAWKRLLICLFSIGSFYVQQRAEASCMTRVLVV